MLVEYPPNLGDNEIQSRNHPAIRAEMMEGGYARTRCETELGVPWHKVGRISK